MGNLYAETLVNTLADTLIKWKAETAEALVLTLADT